MTAAARGRCDVPFVNFNSPDTARRAIAFVRRPGATLKPYNMEQLFVTFNVYLWGTLAVAMLATLAVQFAHLVWCEIRDLL